MNDIRVPQSELDDLTDRLTRTRWPAEAPGDYGITVDRVRALTDHWLHFDWRAHEAELNAIPHATTEIGGDRVHYFHARNPDPAALPLLLTHGWPGSTVEFLDVIGPLSEHFHVVVPAIPGFGLSGPTTRPWGVDRVARAWAELMSRLGYRHFGAQGGDWGSGISRSLGHQYPGRLVGVHVNFLPTPGTADGLTPADEARLAKTMHLAANRHPHQILFAATPQTPAYALTDSPAGLLAFLAEKFDTWADPATPVPDARIVANAAHHWLFRTAGTSARIVKESTPTPRASTPRASTPRASAPRASTPPASTPAATAPARTAPAPAPAVSAPARTMSAPAPVVSALSVPARTAPAPAPTGPQPPLPVPFGVAVLPGDIVQPVRPIAARTHDIRHWTEFPRGGHFPALEVPTLFTADVTAFFQQLPSPPST